MDRHGMRAQPKTAQQKSVDNTAVVTFTLSGSAKYIVIIKAGIKFHYAFGANPVDFSAASTAADPVVPADPVGAGTIIETKGSTDFRVIADDGVSGTGDVEIMEVEPA